MLKSEVEAEELEKQAKDDMKLKNYEKSKLLFEKAKEIYIQLNYMGKVGVIDKQLTQIKRVLEYENRTKKTQPTTNNVNNTSIGETEKSLNKSTIERRIEKNSIETNMQDDKEKAISEAELRRIKLREQSEKQERETELRIIQDSKIKEKEALKNEEVFKKKQEQEKIFKKDDEKEYSIKNAEVAMDRAKSAINNGEFNEAKDFYKKAIEIFKTIGWYDQVDILYTEIKNLEKYKTDFLKKRTYESRKQQQTEEYLQKRTEALIQEKNQKDALELASMQGLPPGIKNVLEKINMLKEKAEKEEKASKFERALNRYKYILELYNTLPSDKIDLTKEISEIKKMMAELEEKIK
jgi:tetratricopeptide (TPR) repeat protein